MKYVEAEAVRVDICSGAARARSVFRLSEMTLMRAKVSALCSPCPLRRMSVLTPSLIQTCVLALKTSSIFGGMTSTSISAPHASSSALSACSKSTNSLGLLALLSFLQ